jgi:hypothetical protein
MRADRPPAQLSLEAALTLWVDFPVDETPRPLVINDGGVAFDGSFPDEDSKLAFVSGTVVSEIDLAPGVLDALAPHRQVFDVPAVRVVAAERGVDEFGTDRGPRALPSWRVRIADIAEPFRVLDPTVRSWWPSPRVPRGAGGAAAWIAADDITLTYRFAGPQKSIMHYRDADVHESPTALIIEPVEEWQVPPGTAIELVALERQVTLHLAAPLGNRALINRLGQPLTVLPDTR